MRQVGTLPNETQARRLVDYLTTQEIESRAEAEDGGWAIWVMDEDQFEQAQDEYQSFRDRPDDPRYTDVADEAQRKRRERAEKQRAAAKNVVEMRGQWNRGMTRRAPATFLLIAACVLVFFLTGMKMDWDNAYAQALAFGPVVPAKSEAYTTDVFHRIKQGEVWRLVSPVFLHGNVFHIFFNVYILYYFGGQIESRRGLVRFLLFVIVAAAISNTAEALINVTRQEQAYPAAFGGFSGVNYALFGYVWMQARYLPKAGFYISQVTVIILVGWFFVSFTGWVGNIANVAHGAGLFIGIVVGYLPVLFPSLEGKI